MSSTSLFHLCGRRAFRALASVVILAALGAPLAAQPSLWRFLGDTRAAGSPESALALVDVAAFDAALAAAPREDADGRSNDEVLLELPMPDGTLARLAVEESPVVEPPLQAWLDAQGAPIRTYVAYDPAGGTQGRLDWGGPDGLHARLATPGGTVLIAAEGDAAAGIYRSSWRADAQGRPAFRCQMRDATERADTPGGGARVAPNQPNTRYQMRLAIAATVEYSAANGGSRSAAQAAIVTGVNMMNAVLEIDLATRLVLVANNQDVVFDSTTGDVYDNSDVIDMIDNNQAVLASAIGNANFDIGHIVGTGDFGGAASLGGACTSFKWDGGTSISPSSGDFFWTDFVLHEIGHQLGGNHTFNGIGGSCGDPGQYNAPTSYEPGAGSTIMSYGGTCNSNDFTSGTDNYFHRRSIEQFQAHINSHSCATTQATGNNAVPTVSAPAGATIPRDTPFELTASASDANGDTLSYCWEQFDLGGTQVSLGTPDPGFGPLFRSFPPVASPTRTFPSLGALRGSPTNTELFPKTNRQLNFVCTVRDNFAGGGLTQKAQTTLTVDASKGPFVVTSQNSGAVETGTMLVTWNVAGTDGIAGAATVDILLSEDNGATFPHLLLAATPNDGSETVNIAAFSSGPTHRVKVKAGANHFFAWNSTPFGIEGPTPPDFSIGVIVLDEVSGNGNAILGAGEVFEMTIPLNNDATAGEATAVSATLATTTPGVVVQQATSDYPDIGFGVGGGNTTPFRVMIGLGVPCPSAMDFTLTVASIPSAVQPVLDFTLPVGAAGGGGALFSDNFDNLGAGWTTEGGGRIVWGFDAGSALGDQQVAGAVDAWLQSPGSMPEGTTLEFDLSYMLDFSFNGAVLEYTVNGTDWIRVPSGAFTQGGYNGTVGQSTSNPLGLAAAWTGNFPSAFHIVVDLMAATGGADVDSYRLRVGCDEFTTANTQFIRMDNFTIIGSGEPQCDPVPMGSNYLKTQ